MVRWAQARRVAGFDLVSHSPDYQGQRRIRKLTNALSPRHSVNRRQIAHRRFRV